MTLFRVATTKKGKDVKRIYLWADNLAEIKTSIGKKYKKRDVISITPLFSAKECGEVRKSLAHLRKNSHVVA